MAGRIIVAFGFLVALLPASGCTPDAVRSPRLSSAEAGRGTPEQLTDSAFAALISRVSEPGGYFDSDNLISNESGFQHPIPRMLELGVAGGAYLGVGPDQNYTYIAHIRPEIAFMVDIRRDALLQHLLYKVLMSRAPGRVEFLCLLLGKPIPGNAVALRRASIPEILEQIDSIPRSKSVSDSISFMVQAVLDSMKFPLSRYDMQSVVRTYTEFLQWGLDLQYTSSSRPSRRNYPNFRSLLLATDLSGNQLGYLASDESYQYVRGMHQRNLIVPVTGNLAGAQALKEIGVYLKERGMVVSALYASNVEYYLWRDGIFGGFANNIRLLPMDASSVIIRSYFNNGGLYIAPRGDVGGAGGAISVQLLQTMQSFVREFRSGGYRSYGDVVSKHSIDYDGSGGAVQPGGMGVSRFRSRS